MLASWARVSKGSMGQDFSSCVLKEFNSTLIDRKAPVHIIRHNCQCEIAFSSSMLEPDRDLMLLILQHRYDRFKNSLYIKARCARLCRLIVWS